jgi:hypothetical protein
MYLSGADVDPEFHAETAGHSLGIAMPERGGPGAWLASGEFDIARQASYVGGRGQSNARLCVGGQAARTAGSRQPGRAGEFADGEAAIAARITVRMERATGTQGPVMVGKARVPFTGTDEWMFSDGR